ncbi:hypothetical protein OIU76_012193 [Salix suchowensis]|nr:hypothetical protein OIU76_012193 [Salix suchowensis]
MLENIVNDIYTGVYHVNVTLYFYKDNAVEVPLAFKNQNLIAPVLQLPLFGDKSMYDPPADLIIPISAPDSSKGYWFIIESELDVKFDKVRVPLNTRKVVLELYVSFHGNDEFWYSNPSNSYIRMNNLSTPRGNGAFREVFVTIDGKLVGSEMPFPVIFTGGINPLFWEPVVAIGAFNLPSYDFDLTPFLGMLLDGKDHVFGIGVTDGIGYWLVDANLHVWLDTASTVVEAKNVVNIYPASQISRSEQYQSLDGSFEIKAEKFTRLEGWVKSMNERIRIGKLSSHVNNKQVSNGWMEVKDHSVLSGEVMTNQTYVCRDEFGCYVRTVAALNGTLIEDDSAILYIPVCSLIEISDLYFIANFLVQNNLVSLLSVTGRVILNMAYSAGWDTVGGFLPELLYSPDSRATGIQLYDKECDPGLHVTYSKLCQQEASANVIQINNWLWFASGFQYDLIEFARQEPSKRGFSSSYIVVLTAGRLAVDECKIYGNARLSSYVPVNHNNNRGAGMAALNLTRRHSYMPTDFMVARRRFIAS